MIATTIKLRNVSADKITLAPFDLEIGEMFLMFNATIGNTYGIATLLMFNHYNRIFELHKKGELQVFADDVALATSASLNMVYDFFAPCFVRHKVAYYSDLSPFYFNMRTGEFTCFNPVDQREYVIQMIPKET